MDIMDGWIWMDMDIIQCRQFLRLLKREVLYVIYVGKEIIFIRQKVRQSLNLKTFSCENNQAEISDVPGFGSKAFLL